MSTLRSQLKGWSLIAESRLVPLIHVLECSKKEKKENAEHHPLRLLFNNPAVI
jgi:hypothetical protein